MNKEEFYNIVQNELDKLEKERKEAQATVDYYDMINEDGSYDNDSFYQEQRKQSEYVLKMCKAKIEKVKDLLGYPLYIRIESMSDFELEQYRTQEISELVSKIKILREEQNERESKIHELKNRQKELISKLVSSSDVQRDEARKEAKEIFEELKKYDSILSEGAINEEIQELEKQIELLKKKTPDEIKKELLSKVPNNGKHITTATRVSKDYPNFVEDIAENYNKVEKVVDLAIKKEELEKNTKEVIYVDDNDFDDIKNNIIYELPKSFTEQMPEKKIEFTTDDGLINLENYINKYQEKVKKVKDEFTSKFCSNGNEISKDLLDLIINRRMNSDTIFDLKTFDKFKDVISSYKIVELTGWLRQKEELSRKIIKTDNIKYKIKNINREISSLQFSILEEIVESYIEKLKEIFDIFYPSELGLLNENDILFFDSMYNKTVIANIEALFYNSGEMIPFIKRVLNAFNSIDDNIEKLKEKIQKIKNDYEKKSQDKKKKISQVDDEIRNISDVEFDADIPYMGSTKEEIEDFIINNVAKQKQDEVATKVEEAPKSKITDLEGLNPEYLEELKKLREKLKEENSNKSKSL